MLLRLGVLVVSAAVLVGACSSKPGEPQPADEQSAAAVQVERPQQEQSTTSYQAGESASSSEDEAAQPAAAQEDEATKTVEQEGRAATGDRTGQGDPADRAQDSAQETEQPSQPSADPPARESGDDLMVSQIIEFGRRAGLMANRNVIGDPDAPILITEYSDFL